MYNIIGYDKEIRDTLRLAMTIKEDEWVDENTIIVCCSPDYSSLTCQLINHSLSSLTDGELLEQIPMEMPYPTMSQIWDRELGQPIPWDKYLLDFFHKIPRAEKYLFIDSCTLRGKNFAAVKRVARAKQLSFKFACVYLDKDSIFAPDYFTEVTDREEQGGILFEWENPNNKNWDY